MYIHILFRRAMTYIYRKLHHCKTIPLQFLSEFCSILPVLLCFCWQIKDKTLLPLLTPFPHCLPTHKQFHPQMAGMVPSHHLPKALDYTCSCGKCQKKICPLDRLMRLGEDSTMVRLIIGEKLYFPCNGYCKINTLNHYVQLILIHCHNRTIFFI